MDGKKHVPIHHFVGIQLAPKCQMELFGATFDKTPKNNKGNSSSQQPDFSGTCFAEGYPLICSKKYGLEDLLETFSDIFASYCGADQ